MAFSNIKRLGWCGSNGAQVCVKSTELAAILCTLKSASGLVGCPKTKTKKQSQHDSHSSRSCQKSSGNDSFKYIWPFSPFEPFAPSHYPSTTSQEFLALMCEHPHFEPSHSGLVSQWAQWTYGSGSFRQYCQRWGVSRLQRHTLPVRQRYLGHVKRCHWRFHFFWKRCVWDYKMASGKKEY